MDGPELVIECQECGAAADAVVVKKGEFDSLVMTDHGIVDVENGPITLNFEKDPSINYPNVEVKLECEACGNYVINMKDEKSNPNDEYFITVRDRELTLGEDEDGEKIVRFKLYYENLHEKFIDMLR